MKKSYGKPVGNDRKMKKVTFVTKYSLEKAEEELDKSINKGISKLKKYGEKAENLKELAFYIKNRQK